MIPASPKISAQSVKVGFTYITESALKTALRGWNPTITRWSAPVLCTVKLVSGVHGAPAQRKAKHVASREEMKQESEKSYSILQHRATHAQLPAKTENVLYKERDVRRKEKGKKIEMRKGKGQTKKKVGRQGRKTKTENPEDKTESSGKTKTKCSRRKEKPKINNRTQHLSALYTNGLT